MVAGKLDAEKAEKNGRQLGEVEAKESQRAASSQDSCSRNQSVTSRATQGQFRAPFRRRSNCLALLFGGPQLGTVCFQWAVFAALRCSFPIFANGCEWLQGARESPKLCLWPASNWRATLRLARRKETREKRAKNWPVWLFCTRRRTCSNA